MYDFFYRRDKTPHLFTAGQATVNLNQSNTYNISRVIVHESFTLTPTLRHDLALFRLSGDYRALPTLCVDDTAASSYDLCYTAGWGSVDGTGE